MYVFIIFRPKKDRREDASTYIKSETTAPHHDIKEDEIASLKAQLKLKRNECDKSNNQLKMETLLVKRFSNDDEQILFYTGFQTYALLLTGRSKTKHTTD